MIEIEERLTKRIFRRVCLRLLQRLTAPKEARRQRIGKKKVRVCDMADGHLLNTIFLFRRQVDEAAAEEAHMFWDASDGYAPGWGGSFIDYAKPLAILEREAARRRLPCKVKPKWLIIRNAKWTEAQNQRRKRS